MKIRILVLFFIIFCETATAGWFSKNPEEKAAKENAKEASLVLERDKHQYKASRHDKKAADERVKTLEAEKKLKK